jgi:predicted RNase H-like HicB family nuclease
MKMETIKKISPVAPPFPFEAYTHILRPLSAEEGGGFLCILPDFQHCFSDGETEEEALNNARDAFASTVSALADMGREIPAPDYFPITTPAEVSGRFVTRVPKSLHAKLTTLARSEGVSLNTLVISFLSAGIGNHFGAPVSPPPG